MGVKGLWTILQACGRPVGFDQLKNKRLAIDASIWIYQFLKAMRGKDGNVLNYAHVLGFFRRVCKLLYWGVKPVFVFDGGVPLAKLKTVSERRRGREGRRKDAADVEYKLMAVRLRQKIMKGENKLLLAKDTPINNDNRNMTQRSIESIREISREEASKHRKVDEFDLPRMRLMVSEMSTENDPRLLNLSGMEAYMQQFGYDVNLSDDDEVSSASNSEDEGTDEWAGGDDAERKADTEGLALDMARRAMKRGNFSAIDFDSDAFQSLPKVDQYHILHSARLRSRLRMGVSKDELSEMFCDKMEFSKFQIERVKQRNELTQRLLRFTQSSGDNANGTWDAPLASDFSRSYQLVKNEGDNGGWHFGVGSIRRKMAEGDDVPAVAKRQKFGFDSDKEDTDDVKPTPTQSIFKSTATVHDEQSDEFDDEFEDVPIEGLNVFKHEETDDGLFFEPDNENDVESIERNLKEQIESTLLPKRTFSPRKPLFKNNIGDLKDRSSTITSMTGSLSKQAAKLNTKARNELITPVECKVAVKQTKERVNSNLKSLDLGTSVLSKSTVTDSPIVLVTEHQKDNSDTESLLFLADSTEKINLQFGNSTKTSDYKVDVNSVKEDHLPQKGESGDNMPVWFRQTEDIHNQKPERDQVGRDNSAYMRLIQILDGEYAEATDPNISDIPKPKISSEKTPSQNTEVQLGSLPDQPVPVTISEAAPARRTEHVSPSAAPDNSHVAKPSLAESSHDVHDKSNTECFSDSLATLESSQVHLSESGVASINDVLTYKQNEADNLASTALTLGLDFQRKARDADEVTAGMISDCQELLRLFGIPFIVAPIEAEAQCSQLVSLGLVDGVITDDSDIFVFHNDAGPDLHVYRHVFSDKKSLECYSLHDFRLTYGMLQSGFISLAELLGSDYFLGLPGVGPVMAIELLSEFGFDLHTFRDWWSLKQSEYLNKTLNLAAETQVRRRFIKSFISKLVLPPTFPDATVRQFYTSPIVHLTEQEIHAATHISRRTHDFSQIFSQPPMPNIPGLQQFLASTVAWPPDKTEKWLLPVVKLLNSKYGNEKSSAGPAHPINYYFENKTSRPAKISSSRVNAALDRLSSLAMSNK